MRKLLIFALAAGAAFGVDSPLVTSVSSAAKSGNFAAANQMLKMYSASRGVTSDYLEAYSWVARGQLMAGNYPAALTTAEDVHKLCLAMLAKRKLDADSALPTALGAADEVTGQALANQGQRDQGVTFLQAEMTKWRNTSIAARIQKNINLLSLEGKPAPPLEISQSVAGSKPRPISAHAGHPVLLFFWAHWCADCKHEGPILEQLRKATGLDVIAPTQHYGYVANGADAAPEVETPYIEKIWRQYYPGLVGVETPLSEKNFVAYGVSTTPTIVVVNGKGVVTTYHPGEMTAAELSAAIQKAAR